ncbi:MAG: hypothetical protein AAGB48_04090 [Planctomycetota bacterium]
MNPAQLRQALSDLTGQRDALIAFTNLDGAASLLTINNAMLVPEEDDGLIKLTDGRSEYIIEPAAVAWIRIGAETPAIASH